MGAKLRAYQLGAATKAREAAPGVLEISTDINVHTLRALMRKSGEHLQKKKVLLDLNQDLTDAYAATLRGAWDKLYATDLPRELEVIWRQVVDEHARFLAAFRQALEAHGEPASRLDRLFRVNQSAVVRCALASCRRGSTTH